MPFTMKIQPIDSQVPAERIKPVVKSRLKRLFERQFSGVLKNPPVEKTAAMSCMHAKTETETASSISNQAPCVWRRWCRVSLKRIKRNIPFPVLATASTETWMIAPTVIFTRSVALPPVKCTKPSRVWWRVQMFLKRIC